MSDATKAGPHGGDGWCRCENPAPYGAKEDPAPRPCYLCARCEQLLRPAGCRCAAAAEPEGEDPYGIAAAWQRHDDASLRRVLQRTALSTVEAEAANNAYYEERERGEPVVSDPRGIDLCRADLDAMNGAVRKLRGSVGAACAMPPCAYLRGSFDVLASFKAAGR